MFLVAITGGIATGKSTASKVFKDHGITVIDADLIARQIVEIGQPAYRQIKKVFGERVLNECGEIDREVLGHLIFDDIELRRKLNDITHPLIHRAIIFQVIRELFAGKQYVVMDLPLLFETGLLLDFIHKVITVTCDLDIQVQRVMVRNKLNEEDAKKRIACQMPLDLKCEKSQFVIDNSGLKENTELEVEKIVMILNSSNHHWRIRSYILLSALAFNFVIYYLNTIFHFLPQFY